MAPTISFVLPVFNEEDVLPELDRRLSEFLTHVAMPAEVIFVDDGSTDSSRVMLRELCQRRGNYRLIVLSRNFGHQAAISAGVEYARGQAVIVMDADLQDPPEVALQMIAKWREGFDVVYGRRLPRASESYFKRLTAAAFYRVFRRLVPIEVPLDTGDFRLMDEKVVLALRGLKETHRFVRGLVAWIGFRQTEVRYERPARFAGQTKYPLSKMLRFAIDGITSFSIVPLRIATWLGLATVALSLFIAARAAIMHFVHETSVPGWTTVVVAVTMLSAVQLVMIGILGEYVGRIYEQVKGRPNFIAHEDGRDPPSDQTGVVAQNPARVSVRDVRSSETE